MEFSRQEARPIPTKTGTLSPKEVESDGAKNGSRSHFLNALAAGFYALMSPLEADIKLWKGSSCFFLGFCLVFLWCYLVSFRKPYQQDHFLKRLLGHLRKLTVFFTVVLGALLSHVFSTLTQPLVIGIPPQTNPFATTDGFVLRHHQHPESTADSSASPVWDTFGHTPLHCAATLGDCAASVTPFIQLGHPSSLLFNLLGFFKLHRNRTRTNF